MKTTPEGQRAPMLCLIGWLEWLKGKSSFAARYFKLALDDWPDTDSRNFLPNWSTGVCSHYHQLSLIGVSAAQIAKKTGRTKISVEDALKAKSTTAGDAALSRGCTIEEALILAE